MKILILGAGSVGGYLGGRLALAGHELFFTARGEHLKALQERGLEVRSINGDFHVKPVSKEKFDTIEKLDLIIVCVKHRDTGSVLPAISEQLGSGTVVMSMQNGVDSEKALEGVVPKGQIIGGIIYIGVALSAPGSLLHSASGKITIGEMGGAKTERVKLLQEMFREAGVPCGVSVNLEKDKWEKLMWNVGFNGLALLTGRSANELANYPPTRSLVRALMGELLEVAGKMGIEVNSGLIEKYIEFTGKGAEIIPSMLQDARAGRPSEVEIMNGKICSEGQRLAVSTPYNAMVFGAISLRDESLLKGMNSC